MIAWQFKLLGKPEIWHHQAQIDSFNTQKTQALLFFLIAEGGQHNRNDLARFFWDDFNLVSSQNNLRTTLYHLKQDFEPCLEIDRHCVSISMPESAYVDLALIDAITPDCGIKALSVATEAYRGDFLEGYTTTLPNFEDWKTEKQAHYRQKIIKYLLRLAELHEKEHQAQQGLAAARRILEIDPVNEAAVLLHMRLLSEMGLQERAIQTYHDYANALKKQSDGLPSPRIKEIYTKLKLPKFTQVRSSLPYIESDLFGREAETDQLIRWLTDPALGWINLNGHSGVGKSQLVISASEKVEENFKDGISYFDLRGFNAGEPDFNIEFVSKLVLATLKVRIVLGKDYPSQLRKTLSQREMLIILDNFETFDGWHVFVTEILLSNPKIKLITTSSQPIKIQGGVTLTLMGLPFPSLEALPSRFDPDFISLYPSLQLFEDRAQQVVQGFKIDQSNYRQIAIMCNLIQGLPSGIDYITNFLDNSSIEDILTAILGNTSQDPALAVKPELSTKLETILDFIWSNQAPDVKDLTLACSLFKGTFSPTDFSAVTMTSTDQLIRLVEEALLYIVTKDKFSLHDLVKVYLDKKGYRPSEPYQRNYSDYFLNELIKLDKAAMSGPYPNETIDQKNADLLHAWEFALEHRSFELIIQSCGPLARAFKHVGLAETAFAHLENSANQLDQPTEKTSTAQLAQGLILLESARLALTCGQAPQASNLAEKAVGIAKSLKDPSFSARCSQCMAQVLNNIGQTTGAIKYAKDGVSQALTAGDERLVANVMITLGEIYYTNHQYDKALTTYQKAISSKFVKNYSRTKLFGYKGMINCLKAQGRFKQALIIINQAQQLNDVLQDVATGAHLTFSGGEINKFVGQIDAAIANFSQASTAFSSGKSPKWHALSLANLGILHNWAGEHIKALEMLEESESLARENSLPSLPEILAIKARSLLAAGQKEAALDIFQSLFKEKPPLPIISSRINLALVEGDHKTALTMATHAMPDLNQLNFDSIDDPFSTYLIFYQALKDQDMPSAHDVLRHARQAFTHLHTHLPAGVRIKSLLAIPHRRHLANIIQEKLEKPSLDQ